MSPFPANELEAIRVQGFPIPTVKLIQDWQQLHWGLCRREDGGSQKHALLCSGKTMSVDGDEKNLLGQVEQMDIQ